MRSIVRTLAVLRALTLLSAGTPVGESARAVGQPFGSVTIPVEFNSNGAGNNVDSIAWE